jgi:hypothetical protein
VSWPSTTGAVARSDRDRVHTLHGSHGVAKIVYVYEVNGTHYHNDKIAFGLFRGMLTWGDADRQLAEFPPGKPVTVYFDPRRPGIACLRRGGVGWEDLFMLVVSVGGLVTGTQTIRQFVKYVGLGRI